jgi:hypothetical protein
LKQQLTSIGPSGRQMATFLQYPGMMAAEQSERAMQKPQERAAPEQPDANGTHSDEEQREKEVPITRPPKHLPRPTRR